MTKWNNIRHTILNLHASIINKGILILANTPWYNSDIVGANRQRRGSKTTKMCVNLYSVLKARMQVTKVVDNAKTSLQQQNSMY